CQHYNDFHPYTF
nr:immunoglobulin light chain junction region [Macaca mulatta]MOX51113.1 immunoglobulin light chain junction region [Macaca mulatta]